MLLQDHPDPHDLGRVGKALLLAHLNGTPGDAATVADRLYANTRHRRVAELLHKAAVGGAGLGGSDWGHELEAFTAPSAAHAELARSMSVLGQLDVRPAPFNVPLAFLATGTRGQFVGERQPIPAVKMTFAATAMLKHGKKIASLAVTSKELLAAPGSEEALSRELAAGIAEGIDVHLLDPTLTLSDGRPASLASLAANVYDGSAVDTVAEIDGLLGAMLQKLVELGSPLITARWIAPLPLLAALATMRDAQGGLAYPTVRAAQDGGTLAGVRVIGTGFGPQDQLLLVDGSEIVVADEGVTRIVTSGQAMIEQDDGPDGNNTLIGMFQTDSLALKALRYINWTMRNPRVVTCAGIDIAVTGPALVE